MGYLEYACVECKEEHEAAFWYHRVVNGREEYLCGAKYTSLADKSGWLPLNPD